MSSFGADLKTALGLENRDLNLPPLEIKGHRVMDNYMGGSSIPLPQIDKTNSSSNFSTIMLIIGAILGIILLKKLLTKS